MYSLSLVLCACALFQGINPSAIPMWEFLSKQEKMSYLYSMFANQVERFCEKTTVQNCNKELLKYGLDKLKDMPEDHLDVMDPYQRNANNIIWDSMMDGHAMMKTTPDLFASTTAKPNSYEDDSFADFGSETAASAKIDNIRVAPPKGFVYTMNSGLPIYTYPSQQQIQQQQEKRKITNQIPLSGPLVIRVYPDGRPVRESTELPQDDDLRQYQLSKVRLPDF